MASRAAIGWGERQGGKTGACCGSGKRAAICDKSFFESCSCSWQEFLCPRTLRLRHVCSGHSGGITELGQSSCHRVGGAVGARGKAKRKTSLRRRHTLPQLLPLGSLASASSLKGTAQAKVRERNMYSGYTGIDSDTKAGQDWSACGLSISVSVSLTGIGLLARIGARRCCGNRHTGPQSSTTRDRGRSKHGSSGRLHALRQGWEALEVNALQVCVLVQLPGFVEEDVRRWSGW